LHMHTLLQFNDFPNPNTLVQTLFDDEIFWQKLINYLNDIITRDIIQYKSCPIIVDTNCIDDNLDNIHPYITRPLDKNSKMTFINWWIYAIDAYVGASKKSCRYGFPQPLVNEIHFNIEMKLLHIKKINKRLHNANPWILLALRCDHDLKFIAASSKDSKSLIYDTTKTSIYSSHMFFFCKLQYNKWKFK
jgi:hypothetical protein